jgi:large subunit ribosomal protein L3
MPRTRKPRRGSLQYWPRKRAKRIYPRLTAPPSDELKPLGFAGWKAGMTHILLIDDVQKSPSFGKAVAKPATIIDAPSLFVCGIRTYKKTVNGLQTISEKWAEKIPKGLEIERKTKTGSRKDITAEGVSDVRLIVSTQPSKSGMHKKKPDIFEIPVGGKDAGKKFEYASSLLGKELNASDVFKAGEYVDASGVTKGFGFTGPVKRFGIRIQTRKDKQMHRHVGSIGSTTPRKVDWRVPAPGQHGFHTRTEFNKKVLIIDSDIKKIMPKGGLLGYGIPSSYVLVEGSVPGSRKRLVMLKKAWRPKRFSVPDIKFISTESKQGA